MKPTTDINITITPITRFKIQMPRKLKRVRTLLTKYVIPNHVNYYGQTMAMKVPAYTFVKADGTAAAGYGAKDYGTEPEKWTICGSLCTVADVIVKNLPIGKPESGDMIIFYNIGAYSVTEGIYLFLSRKMPKIIAYSEKEGTSLYRDFKFSDKINSREDLI